MLPFRKPSLEQQTAPLILEEKADNRAEELLLDSLISKAYRDNNKLEELMTI
jgi:hypothetical protein